MTFSFRSRTSLLLLAGFFLAGAASQAQQPAATATMDERTPSEAAQPASQAAASASAPVTSPTTQAEPQGESGDKSVRLGAGDLIEVSVYNVPELASKVRVSSAGDVYLPLVDYIHVDGLTLEEAQTVIAKRLEDGGFVRNPHVSIFVDEASSQGVTVIGEVARPGIYPDVADHKLYEVISEAGGFNPIASRKIAILRRNHAEPIRVDLPRNLADNTTGNVDIMPGDTITVPKAPIIYVVGDVSRPSGLLVDNGSMTVLQALALAGGTNRTAKLSAARIIHKTPTGMTETKVAIKKMLEAKAPDVPLEADDILFIPVSGGRVLASRTFEAAMSAATAVSIYTVKP